MMNLTKVLIADDDPGVLKSLNVLVSMEQDFKVIGHARNGVEAIKQARSLNPDVILMDIQMPQCSGLEATKTIKAELPDTKVIILTIHTNELSEAISAGASKYLLKDSPPDVLYSAIRATS
jgi:DNA-binding NarL/FixJ family response regulator